MSFWRLYRCVVVLLAPERGLAITLVLANAALAAAAFLGPLLFGSIVDTLASSGGGRATRPGSRSCCCSAHGA